ncbi:SUPPRESSOR OF GAMMA RESPONSE 1-like isoform X2 [Tasmannia lanceolata]|uniref:SUPPRESSOR OF GAMMA RESPONSE 1-like isoform X2 n=1 Tax=Tasmannia lanceolata TaxID=3420 RepID=UPI004062DA0B
MARTWLINSRGIAKKVKNASQVPANQIKDWITEAHRQCPNCNHRIDNTDVSIEWPGLPAGVKFDPSDVELLEHLAGKIGVENSKPHLFLDEFIPTLKEDGGICYTHPGNLPGVKKDGSSVHFFYRTANAYATGHRKRRRINGHHTSSEEHIRWHKTGKTRPILENGVQKGCKKIMVLYKSSQKGSKPNKSNWVMHQYHLGTEEDERDGQLVVSKIFYQQLPKQLTEKTDIDLVHEKSDILTVKASPRTPKTKTPNPPRAGKHSPCDGADEEEKQQPLPGQDAEFISVMGQIPNSAVHLEDENVKPSWWAGESQAVEDPNPNDDDLLLCHEILDSSLLVQDTFDRNFSPIGGISDLDNLEMDVPPDFDLADLQFGSQESITGWLDRL